MIFFSSFYPSILLLVWKIVKSESQTILMFPPEEAPLAEIASQTQKIEHDTSVDPSDMRDDRIVDYTLNR